MVKLTEFKIFMLINFNHKLNLLVSKLHAI